MKTLTIYRCTNCQQMMDDSDDHVRWDWSTCKYIPCGPLEKFIGIPNDEVTLETEWGLSTPDGTITQTIINLADAYLAHEVYTRKVVVSKWNRIDDDV